MAGRATNRSAAPSIESSLAITGSPMRRAFALFSGLSAIGFLGFGVAWIGLFIRVNGPPVWIEFGDFTVVATGQYRQKDDDWMADRLVQEDFWLDSRLRLATWQEPGEAGRRWRFAVRTFLLVGATAVLPALWGTSWAIGFWRFLRRTNGGRCGGCGYDLRTSPDRCPECSMNVSPVRPVPGME